MPPTTERVAGGLRLTGSGGASVGRDGGDDAHRERLLVHQDAGLGETAAAGDDERAK